MTPATIRRADTGLYVLLLILFLPLLHNADCAAAADPTSAATNGLVRKEYLTPPAADVLAAQRERHLPNATLHGILTQNPGEKSI